MKHWISSESDCVEVNSENFYSELKDLYKKYGISISHEDSHGGFILEEYNEFNIQWIEEAAVTTKARDILNRQPKG